MISLVDMAVCASFVGFCLMGGARLKKAVRDQVHAYQEDIRQRHVSMKHMLDGVHDHLLLAKQNYATMDARKQDILALAEQEVSVLWAQAKKIVKDLDQKHDMDVKQYQHALRVQALKHAQKVMWRAVHACIKKELHPWHSCLHRQFLIKRLRLETPKIQNFTGNP